MPRPQAEPERHLQKWNGQELEVCRLIMDGDDFIVFLDPVLDVDWLTADQYTEPEPDEVQRRNHILNRAASLECVPNGHHEPDIRVNFKRMVGEGVARALDRDCESAAAMLDQARDYIEDRNVEKARLWQLSTGCIIGIVLLALGLVGWTIRNTLISVWSGPVFFLTLAGGAGALGAVLSMIFRMGSTFPTSEAPQSLHRLEAISRVFAGALSALFITAAIRSGLILPRHAPFANRLADHRRRRPVRDSFRNSLARPRAESGHCLDVQ